MPDAGSRRDALTRRTTRQPRTANTTDTSARTLCTALKARSWSSCQMFHKRVPQTYRVQIAHALISHP